jgi:hypothetical protein
MYSTGTEYPTVYENGGKGMSAFTCYMYKYHHGDFDSAVKKAYEDGYGTRRKAPAPIIEVENIVKGRCRSVSY